VVQKQWLSIVQKVLYREKGSLDFLKSCLEEIVILTTVTKNGLSMPGITAKNPFWNLYF